jgi:hypothetical protein
VVDAEFRSEALDANNIVIDIGFATDSLRAALEPLRYRNLDEVAQFANAVTTTEFLARYIHGAVGGEGRGRLRRHAQGDAARIATWPAAGYEGPVRPGA